MAQRLMQRGTIERQFEYGAPIQRAWIAALVPPRQSPAARWASLPMRP